MKKVGLILWGCLISSSVMAAGSSFLKEAALLGTMAGLAESCGESDKKMSDFELIAARVIALKANSDKEEILGYRRYAEEKSTAMRKQKENPQMSCRDILYHFGNMPIFQSVVYSDGSLKLSDGTFLKATRPPAQLKKKE